jgi:beta-aspartyl-peptidase (threonine type)
VEEAVRVLEENEHFNAGCGSLLNNDCEVECDAMIMEGYTLNNGRITLIIYMLLSIVHVYVPLPNYNI